MRDAACWALMLAAIALECWAIASALGGERILGWPIAIALAGLPPALLARHLAIQGDPYFRRDRP